MLLVHRFLPFVAAFLGGLFFLSLYYFFWSPPIQFPSDEKFVIEDGESIESVGILFEKNGVIRSPFVFKTLVRILGESGVIAGGYIFDSPKNVFGVVRTVTSLEAYKKSVKVTFPEGITNKDMALICSNFLSFCDKEAFLFISKNHEGYLFPDTYFFSSNADETKVVGTLMETHKEKIKKYENDIKLSTHSLQEIITMASILEKEAHTAKERRIISGILWKRIKIKMPLQVDAVFEYINGKNTFELTTEDLKIDSPYNTYKYLGLPPTPISNPSIDSIEAAIYPTASPYLYYLSDKDGSFHYAKTHDGHVANKQRYLRK